MERGTGRKDVAWRVSSPEGLPAPGCPTHSPIQHSKRAQGVVFTTSGGSTPTFRHSTKATLTVFICNKQGVRPSGLLAL